MAKKDLNLEKNPSIIYLWGGTNPDRNNKVDVPFKEVKFHSKKIK